MRQPVAEHFLVFLYSSTMARGNQRELARKKNQKKAEEAAKGKKGDYAKRMQNDGDILREKQRLADERKAQEALAKAKK